MSKRTFKTNPEDFISAAVTIAPVPMYNTRGLGQTLKGYRLIISWNYDPVGRFGDILSQQVRQSKSSIAALRAAWRGQTDNKKTRKDLDRIS